MAEVNDENFNQILKEIEQEENGVVTESKEFTDVTESAEGNKEHNKTSIESESNPDAEYYPHIGIMEDEGIVKKELPKDIQDMITTFNRKKRMAEMKNAKESTFLQIRNLSAIIADKIMDWIERDLDEVDDTIEKKSIGGSIDNDDEEVMDTEVHLEDGGAVEEDSKEETKESGEGSIFGGILGGIFDW